jgi:hypothetical protein
MGGSEEKGLGNIPDESCEINQIREGYAAAPVGEPLREQPPGDPFAQVSSLGQAPSKPTAKKTKSMNVKSAQKRKIVS